MELKIGQHTYTITESDIFFDDGARVRLLTQSKEKPAWGESSAPVLSKKACKEISVFERVFRSSGYTSYAQCFSLELTNQDTK